MPTVLNKQGYRFFFYTLDRLEAPHIRVAREGKRGKFWLNPVMLAYAHDLRADELRTLHTWVSEYRALFWAAWHRHFRL